MSLVQPIAVKPAGHEATILAAAIASASLLAELHLNLALTGQWSQWLAQSFTKSVRRTKTASKFNEALALEEPKKHVEVDGAQAIAFAPQSYEQFDPVIAKMQVAGLQRPKTAADDEAFIKHGAYTPELMITDAVELSTGKAAAQVAHGLCAWVLNEDPHIVTQWLKDPGAVLSTGSLAAVKEPMVTIVDSGLTEITPGTPTVIVTGHKAEEEH